MESSKRDWKLFREKISTWQENYMEKLVMEYAALLNDDLPASSKFWELENRIKQDKKKPGVIINIRKQEMLFEIIRLINDGAITMDDLSDFSDELRNQVNGFYKQNGG
ncbi:MAG: hypothetical protein SCL54_16045 [Bacillota bacterium]|nr:hypothetical protein [Bacillota bacterium]